jgi:hypothetical protein
MTPKGVEQLMAGSTDLDVRDVKPTLTPSGVWRRSDRSRLRLGRRGPIVRGPRSLGPEKRGWRPAAFRRPGGDPRRSVTARAALGKGGLKATTSTRRIDLPRAGARRRDPPHDPCPTIGAAIIRLRVTAKAPRPRSEPRGRRPAVTPPVGVVDRPIGGEDGRGGSTRAPLPRDRTVLPAPGPRQRSNSPRPCARGRGAWHAGPRSEPRGFPRSGHGPSPERNYASTREASPTADRPADDPSRDGGGIAVTLGDDPRRSPRAVARRIRARMGSISSPPRDRCSLRRSVNCSHDDAEP